jgi:hypothetical protein
MSVCVRAMGHSVSNSLAGADGYSSTRPPVVQWLCSSSEPSVPVNDSIGDEKSARAGVLPVATQVLQNAAPYGVDNSRHVDDAEQSTAFAEDLWLGAARCVLARRSLRTARMHGRAVITGVSSERRSGRSSYSEHAAGRARIESDVADGIVTTGRDTQLMRSRRHQTRGTEVREPAAETVTVRRTQNSAHEDGIGDDRSADAD